ISNAPGGAAAGDLSGAYPNPTVAMINGNPLGSTAPTAGNLLVADGANWVTQAMSGDATIDATGALTFAVSGVVANTYGDASNVPVITVDATGRLPGAGPAAISNAPGGAAAGDLSGAYPNPTVAKINGAPLGVTTAIAGNVLVADGANWVTQAMSG